MPHQQRHKIIFTPTLISILHDPSRHWSWTYQMTLVDAGFTGSLKVISNFFYPRARVTFLVVVLPANKVPYSSPAPPHLCQSLLPLSPLHGLHCNCQVFYEFCCNKGFGWGITLVFGEDIFTTHLDKPAPFSPHTGCLCVMSPRLWIVMWSGLVLVL